MYSILPSKHIKLYLTGEIQNIQVPKKSVPTENLTMEVKQAVYITTKPS